MLADLQERFAQCCRTGEIEPVGGVEERRLEIYRRAVFGQIIGILERAYPLACDALGEGWESLCQEFFADHECVSPHLWQMPRGLLEYVEQRGTEIPWLLDLLRFEWGEIEVHMAPDVEVESKTEGELASDPLVINPQHSLDHFTYPVWRERGQAQVAGSHFLFSYRHPQVLDARFMELSPLLAVAVSLIAGEPMLVVEALERAAIQLKLPIDEKVCQKGIQFFENMLAQGAALGFAKEETQ